MKRGFGWHSRNYCVRRDRKKVYVHSVSEQGGTREIKNEKEKRYQAEKKEKKDEKKIEKWYQ